MSASFARNIHKSFGSRHVLRDFNLILEPGRKYAVFGPNGSGKTTLIKTMATLIEPDQGLIEICGFAANKQQALARRNLSAYFFSNRGLWPHLTVLENWRAHARLFGTPSEVWNRKFENLKAVAEPIMNLYPHQLSLGMRQLALISRCLLKDAAIYLLDEPFAVLDDGITHKLIENLALPGSTVLVTGQNHVRPRLEGQFHAVEMGHA